MPRLLDPVLWILLASLCIAPSVWAQTTEFDYQGSLKDGANQADGSYDFEFALFDAESGGAQLGSTQTRSGVAVTNGIFAIKLDFGSQFPGANRFLAISVRQTGGGGFTTLTPRQSVSSSPYSVRSLNSTTADTATSATTANNSLQLGGVAASQYVITTDPRMTDARNPLPGSANYIWNQNAVLQPSSNFVISGNGDVGGTLSANVVRSETQYNIGGNRVLSVAGTDNVFAGVGAGTANLVSGSSNSFFGHFAGNANTSADSNSFFGRNAGRANTTGGFNSFFGSSAGANNLGAGSNSFFGGDAGLTNTSGSSNSFFGGSAGRQNMTGGFNSFFGASAGRENTEGVYNSFFGASSGRLNTTGDDNSFFGTDAGLSNTEGESNSFFGRSAGNLNTAGNNNSFFGRSAGLNNTTGDNNAFFGLDAGRTNAAGFGNSFFGQSAGESNTSGYANSFFGRSAGLNNTIGNNNTIIGDNANVASGELTYATAIGAGSIVSASNTLVIGRFLDDVRVPGNLVVSTLGAGGATSICRNASGQISTCSSSLRYKKNIGRFGLGLALVELLRPITFDWKEVGMHDLGLGAEDVAAIEPLLVTYNQNGEVEGVKYDRISIVLVNAIKEQQAQIEGQKMEIESLKAIVCELKPAAAICKIKEK